MKAPLVLLPRIQKLLSHTGQNIRLARLRRRFSTQQVAERAGISRPTLKAIEDGAPTVSMGAYLQVLLVLGLENDITLLGQDDVLGHKLQDAGLLVKERAPKRKPQSKP
jgi:transcriptional regulator with XRE-family HTH domain